MIDMIHIIYANRPCIEDQRRCRDCKEDDCEERLEPYREPVRIEKTKDERVKVYVDK